MCKKQGITLIEIPYNIKFDDIEELLKKKLKENGFEN